VEPAAEGVAPLSLVPLDSDPAGNAAWLDVEDCNLDLIGLEARCPDFKLALLPPYLVRVRGGNLRVHGCRLYGPLGQPPDAYRGLVRLEGSNQPTPDRAMICSVNESVLVSGKNGLQVSGTGARLALHQSVVVTGGDALSFEPKTAEAKMNLSCEFDHTTVAVQGAVLRLGTVTGTDLPLEPLVVQAQASAFLAPFAGQRSGLLVCEGESLARGLLVWQGVSNVYDKRLHSFITLADESPQRPQPFTAWTRLWGPMNERHAFVNVPLTSTWKWEPLRWEPLMLPEIKPPSGSGASKPRPGADLAALGLLPKPVKPMK
jgi:hypothetical protein